jgi:hypothetical protein
MTASNADDMRVTVHLVQQSTVTFSAAQLWPMEGAYSRFGPDLESFAREVTRRLQTDGFVGFHADAASISVVPLAAVKRLDFTAAPAH